MVRQLYVAGFAARGAIVESIRAETHCVDARTDAAVAYAEALAFGFIADGTKNGTAEAHCHDYKGGSRAPQGRIPPATPVAKPLCDAKLAGIASCVTYGSILAGAAGRKRNDFEIGQLREVPLHQV